MNLEERAKRLYELFYPCLSLTDCIPVAKYVESAIRQGQIDVLREVKRINNLECMKDNCIGTDCTECVIDQKLSELEKSND